jgi:hypothetical protein
MLFDDFMLLYLLVDGRVYRKFLCFSRIFQDSNINSTGDTKKHFNGKILRIKVKKKHYNHQSRSKSYNSDLEKIWKKGLIGASLRNSHDQH